MMRSGISLTLAAVWLLCGHAAGDDRPLDLTQAPVGSDARLASAAALRDAQSAAQNKVDFSDPHKGLTLSRIVFATRQNDTDGHWYANFGTNILDPKRTYYHDGGRLCLLDLKSGKLTILIDDPKGGIRDPQVHYDGRRILFCWRKDGGANYHLYEINADGTGLRQLTDGPFDDIEPTYLPSGDIVFCSSRCNRWVPCWFTQVAILHRCDPDGKNIRALSANTEQENTPWPLADGRVLFQRWEYVDRSQVGYHHLWTMNPDGTGLMVFFGNQHPNVVMIDAKPIPGTRKVVASFSPGHGRTEHAGAIAIIDPDKGPDAKDMARTITKGHNYRDPYPLSENLFLVATDYAIELIDDLGNSTVLWSMPEDWRTGRMCVHEPRPLIAREKEYVIPARADLAKATGTVILEDIYAGRNMDGVQRGQIKKLLVLEILPKPYNIFSGMEPLSYGGTFLLERILGTVPVEADGSAYVEIPALRPVFFVALDEKELSVKRMQSFLTLQPGETQSCVGCHDKRIVAPRSSNSLMALQRPPSMIEPFANVPDLIDFPRDIQPLLDKYCVACHDYDASPRGGPMSGGLIFSGDHGPMFSHSYYNLTISGQYIDGRNLRKSDYAPRAIGSGASKLVRSFENNKATADDLRLIRLWIDSGASYPGTYAAMGTGSIGIYARGSLERDDLNWPQTIAARNVIAKRCAGCHTGETTLPDSPSDDRRLVPWNEGPMNLLASGISRRNTPAFRFNRHLLYNLSRPEKSLLLLAPLAKTAGGYGICKKNGDPANVFSGTDDPDFQTLLTAIRSAKQHLDQIKRFDMPGFQPRAEYIRELKRFGILSSAVQPGDPVNVYELDRAYWKSHWYRPPQN